MNFQCRKFSGRQIYSGKNCGICGVIFIVTPNWASVNSGRLRISGKSYKVCGAWSFERLISPWKLLLSYAVSIRMPESPG